MNVTIPPTWTDRLDCLFLNSEQFTGIHKEFYLFAQILLLLSHFIVVRE